jgi:hypothetical protein
MLAVKVMKLGMATVRVVKLGIMTGGDEKLVTVKTDQLVKLDKGWRLHDDNEGNLINKCNV